MEEKTGVRVRDNRTLHPLERSVREFLRKRGIRRVLAGISGGADSTALLHALLAAGAEVEAVHCNFHLRGSESDRDMAFAEGLCKRLGVNLTTIHFDTEKHRTEKGISTELACRELRYDLFRKLLSERGLDRIVVAHNADDQAETVLLNLMRGAGVSGMRGMLPDTGSVIRPLLQLSRSEILVYLDEIGETFVEDSSNGDNSYRRNFIRNEVLPLLESRWPSAKASICKTASIMAAEEERLDNFDPTRKVRKWVRSLGANSTQAAEIITALDSEPYQPGKCWIVKDGRIYTDRKGLLFIAHSQEIKFEIESEERILTDEEIKIGGHERLYTDLPRERLLFRHPKPGDRIKPLGMSGSMAVSKVMKDAKLSQYEKETTILAEDRQTGEIIWVSRLKRSRLHLAEPGTTGCVYGITTASADDCKFKRLECLPNITKSLDFR